MLVYQENKNHYLWNIIVVLATTYIAIYVPLVLLIRGIGEGLVSYGYWVATFLLIIDLGFNIYRYRKDNLEQQDPLNPQISSKQLLMADFFSAIPMLYISSFGIISLLQLSKLFRIGQFLHRLQRIEIKYERVLTILFFLFWLILAVHWLACGWLALIGMDPSVSNATNYIRAIYWTITTLTSVGYGDILPTTNSQMLYSMFVQLMGIGAFGYLIAHVVSVLSKKDSIENLYVENIEHLTTTLKRRHLPNSLQKRILNYYTYIRHEKVGFDESAFLNTLPLSLRSEVALSLRKEFIEQIPLFIDAEENFISEIATKLELIVATPGDYIFKQGDPGAEMYLIINGNVEVLGQENNNVLAILSEGDYFGEIALFSNKERTASIRAKGFCNLYRLKKETFEEVNMRYPKVAAQIEEKAKERGLNYK